MGREPWLPEAQEWSAVSGAAFGLRLARRLARWKPASRARALARRGWWVPQPGGDLSEVPAVSANYLAGASAGGERPILLWSICFFIASAPFLTLQSLLWLVSEMPRRVLTLRGGRGEESRQPPPSIPLHTPPKKKKISAVFFNRAACRFSVAPSMTWMTLGERIVLLSASWWLFCPFRRK